MALTLNLRHIIRKTQMTRVKLLPVYLTVFCPTYCRLLMVWIDCSIVAQIKVCPESKISQLKNLHISLAFWNKISFQPLSDL